MKRKLLLFFTITIFLGLTLNVYSQTKEEKVKLIEQTKVNYLLDFAKEKSNEYQINKAKAIDLAKKKGWIISKEIKGGNFMELQGVTEDGRPLYYITHNATAAISTATDKVYSGGGLGLDLDGTGMVAGEWDGGDVLTSHQEFNNTGSSRVTDKDGVSSTHYHATHVAGTIMAGGVQAAAKGMAYNANLDAYDWTNDESEMAIAAAAGLLISNHSYGYGAGWTWTGSAWEWYGDESISTEEDYQFGFYSSYCAGLDNIANNAPNYLIVKSAGNDQGDGAGESGHPQDGGADGFDCISYKGNAKNILTVGAANDVSGGYTQPSDVTLASFSSTGPCDDSRIKPDIVGNGVGLYSTYDDNNTAYNSISGTSMSSPNVTGSLLLLQEHYNESFGSYMKAASLKALAIHTADECGTSEGPDYKFGWGLLNTGVAANVISEKDNQSYILEETYSGSVYTLDVTALGTEPLVVTIVWSDPAGTPVAAALDPTDIMLVNDLDMTITGDGGPYFPYKLSAASPASAATKGDNDVDNVEKIYIANPTAGNYTITINHEGTISGGTQDFSIIVTGIGVNSDEPIVTTNDVSSITETTAQSGGNVINEGASSVTERGIVWSASENPTLNDELDTDGGTGTGSYSSSMTGLSAATKYYVRAYATNNIGTGYGDNISFTTTCTPPANQATNFATPVVNDNDITLTWTSAGDHVIVIAKEGSVIDEDPFRGEIYIANSDFTLGEDLGSGNIVVYSGTDETTTVTNLFESTEYYFAIYKFYNSQKCYNTTSPLTGNISTTGYCEAFGGGDEFIDGVTFGDISTSGTGANSYENFTNLSTDVEPGEVYTLTVVNGNTYSSDDLAVWIDFSDNGSFDDVGENVVCAVNDGANGDYSITIPEEANSGSHRMRIRMKYNDADCGSSCGETQYGEVEDYTVNVLSAKSDLSISSFILVNPTVETGDTITVNINIQNLSTNASANASTIYYYLSVDETLDVSDTLMATFTSVPVIDPDSESGVITDYLIFNDCEAAGSYYIIAKADGLEQIDELDETNNTQSVPLVITAANPIIDSGTINNITANTASMLAYIFCDGGTTIIEKGVYVGTEINPEVTGTKFVNTDQETDFTTNLTSLLPGTKYYARAFATNSNGTSYGDTVEFETDNITVTNITNSTADVNWGHLGISATNYVVFYYEKYSSENSFKTINASSATIYVLPNTTYIARLKYYSGGTWSAYMEPIEFITASGAQVVASDIVVTNITANTADINWTGMNADTYNILYYETGTTNQEIVQSSTSPATISILPSTNYMVRVQSIINGEKTNYTAPVEFTSLAGSQVIADNVTIDNISSSSANVNWDGSGADAYNILYYETGTTNQVVLQTSSSPATISVLPATNYTVRVQSIINGQKTNYTTPVEFSSLAGSQVIADNVSIDNITSSSANVNWDGSGADAYNILYYETGTTNQVVLQTSSSSIAIPVLPATNYSVRVQSIINGQKTTYTAPVEFSSLAGSQVIADNVSIDNITSSSANVNWDGSGADAYNVLYYETGTSNKVVLQVLSSPATINILPATNYDVRVQSIINGIKSNYTTAVSFSSLAVPPALLNSDTYNRGNNERIEEGEVIEELQIVKTIRQLYPNPATDFINLDLLFEKQVRIQVSIIDINGRIVKTFDRFVQNQTESFNIEDLQTGIYFVKISSTKYSETHRLIKK